MANLIVGNCYSTFSTTFDDFFITSIGGVTQTSTQFWGILLNFEFTQVGGCQQEVNANDEILFAFDAFNANAFLKLTGPATARINKMFFVTVTDAQTGKPVAGAAVSFGISDANGNVPFNLGFTRIGVQKFKATKPGAIRSNEITIVVSAWFLEKRFVDSFLSNDKGEFVNSNFIYRVYHNTHPEGISQVFLRREAALQSSMVMSLRTFTWAFYLNFYGTLPTFFYS